MEKKKKVKKEKKVKQIKKQPKPKKQQKKEKQPEFKQQETQIPQVKKEKKTRAKLNGKRLLIAIIIIIAVIYIVYAVMLLNKNESGTIFVEQGTILKEETVVGYIIRNEQVIKGEEYQNGIIHIAGEGEKVSKNEAIFQYYSDKAKELTNKVVEMDLKIQEKLKTEKITSNADIKLIEKQIEEKIEKLKNLNNIQEITENNQTIKNLLEKKIATLAENTGATDELKQLIKKRDEFVEQIRNSTKYLSAPISGIVSYRVDGLETELTTENFEKYNSNYLEKLDLKTGQIIASSIEAGKVIDNFTYYLATTVNSKEAMNTKVGKTIKIRLSTNDEITAEIVHINQENNKRVLILKIDRLTEKLINYRKISFDIIWSSDSGLKVPKKAIAKDEKGLSYVIRTKSGYLSKLIVKVINSNENYSIVKTYNTEELTNLGFTQEEISEYKKIKLYDEILLNPSIDKLK